MRSNFNISLTIIQENIKIFVIVFFLYFFSDRYVWFLYCIPFTYFLFYFVKNKNFKLRYTYLHIIYYLFIFIHIGNLLIGDLLNRYSIRSQTALYIAVYFIPMTLMFNNEINKIGIKFISSYMRNSYLILSLIIFVLFLTGIIASNRYQHVGNILAAAIVLICGLKDKKKRSVLIGILGVCMLVTGSRQALLGVLVCFLVFYFVSNIRRTLKLFLFMILIFAMHKQLFDLMEYYSYKYNLLTLKRIVIAIHENGGNSINTRLRIYGDLIDKISILPNYNFVPNQDLLLPHNFFLEYFIFNGFILGLFFMLFIVFILAKSLLNFKRNILFYFVLFYFIAFNVSTGIGAAKYFLFYFLIFISLNESKAKNSFIS